MTEGDSPGPVDDRSGGGFARCPKCAMELRRTELDAHLAHAHNIGPGGGGKKDRDRSGRNGGRSGGRPRPRDE